MSKGFDETFKTVLDKLTQCENELQNYLASNMSNTVHKDTTDPSHDIIILIGEIRKLQSQFEQVQIAYSY